MKAYSLAGKYCKDHGGHKGLGKPFCGKRLKPMVETAHGGQGSPKAVVPKMM